MTMTADRLRFAALGLIGVAGAMLGTAAVHSVQAARQGASPQLPEIKLSATNRVPGCIRPERLDAHLLERNPNLEARFRAIAGLYRTHGERLGLRWDYAFYQMILETGSLKFGNDVKPRQNNFAGLGATGGGVRGESFKDVETGVIAHLQHLVAYAGEKVENPVAERTREHQDGIIFKSKQLGRAVRFSDLTNRWAMDRNYARSIETLAERFRDASCSGAAPEPRAPAPVAANRSERKVTATAAVAPPAARPQAAATAVAACTVMAASFASGGPTLLIRGEQRGEVRFTALGVESGAEQLMAESYMGAHAPGGRIAGRFRTQDEAVRHAYDLCDSGKP
jgi:hypothetical protein